MRPRTTITVAGLVLLLYVGLVIGIYIWQFRDLPFLSGTTESWGQFGDYVGGLLNPALALLNVGVIVYLAIAVQRLNESQREHREESEKRVQTVIELHREWNSETIYQSRTSAGKLVRLFPDSSYFEIEEEVPYERASHIWVVVGFFQRLAFLSKHGRLHVEMVRELFAELFVWWWVVSFATQLDRCDCDARTQMIDLKDWFDSITTPEQRMPWLERANRDLAAAREAANLPPVIVM
ncbi:hypothetical protein ACPOLB_23480 [Rubrivivax sp. RP6-9]|uniref:hypothetical protein n=1 Tax=Rubrivivax sp. RP6-9 TaxID=3415750 RepID=UPI003CC69AF8